MSILNLIISGAVRSIKSIKAVLLIWLCTLFLGSMVALPFKSGVRTVLGSSMITEKLKNGINIDVLTDFGTNLTTILSALTSGILLLILFGFLLNVFFNGGLFTTLRLEKEKYSTLRFFSAAGTCFWPFLMVTVIMSLIILILPVIIFGITFAVTGPRNSAAEGSMLRSALTGGIIFALILPVFLLVADYARVWQAASSQKAVFRAIGVGFRQTFKFFFPSYPVMLINTIIQALFAWFVLKYLSGSMPQTGGGIFLLFLLSQFLFIIKILLRVWRYGSVTAMYEKHPV